jgi:hypothetical protein
MIPVDRSDVSVVPLEGFYIFKLSFSFKIFINNRILGASLGYHCSNEEC